MKKLYLLSLLLSVLLVSCGSMETNSQTYASVDKDQQEEVYKSLKAANQEAVKDNKHLSVTSSFSILKTADNEKTSFSVTREFKLSLAEEYVQWAFKETYPSGWLRFSRIYNQDKAITFYREAHLTSGSKEDVVIGIPFMNPVTPDQYVSEDDLGVDYDLSDDDLTSWQAKENFTMSKSEGGYVTWTYLYEDENGYEVTYTVAFDEKGRLVSREFFYSYQLNGVAFEVKAAVKFDYSSFSFEIPEVTDTFYQAFQKFGLIISKIYSSIPLTLVGNRGTGE